MTRPKARLPEIRKNTHQNTFCTKHSPTKPQAHTHTCTHTHAQVYAPRRSPRSIIRCCSSLTAPRIHNTHIYTQTQTRAQVDADTYATHTPHIRHTHATHTPHIRPTYATHTPGDTYATHTPHIHHTYATHTPILKPIG